MPPAQVPPGPSDPELLPSDLEDEEFAASTSVDSDTGSTESESNEEGLESDPADNEASVHLLIIAFPFANTLDRVLQLAQMM